MKIVDFPVYSKVVLVVVNVKHILKTMMLMRQESNRVGYERWSLPARLQHPVLPSCSLS